MTENELWWFGTHIIARLPPLSTVEPVMHQARKIKAILTENEKAELADVSIIIHNLTGRAMGFFFVDSEDPPEVLWLMKRYSQLLNKTID